ncbi:MAG: hypothetical protein KYQ20_01275 [Candidatus Nealsonbacteria bacterium]|nr:hypothetical protein [Candidatus Nealsonbacteria bacterium]
MKNSKKRLIIIDSNSIIHRAFHALPPLMTKKGEIVGAVYGFLLVFLKAIKDFQPDFVVACFDLPGLTFRHEQFKEYKANRPPTPKQLSQQIPKIKEILKSFNVPIFTKQGFEADDIIGAIAKLAPLLFSQKKEEGETIILSGDSDTFQLINSQTKVFALRKGVKDIALYDKELIKTKFQGLKPEQLVAFKALAGDPSDNIPGAPGVGKKTATKLVLEFNSLKNLYFEIKKGSEKAQKIKPKLKETLLKYKDQVFVSKMLVEIKTDVLIDFNLEKCHFGEYDKEKVVKVLRELEFYSLISKVSKSL